MSEPRPAAEPHDSRGGAAAREQSQQEPAERYGILTIERLRKDDGRALLLYARERQGA